LLLNLITINSISVVTPQERKNRRIGYAVSIGLHALLILLFIFLVAWHAPDPPLPEYGIELNFGVSETGRGDVQPLKDQPMEEVLEDEAVETEESEPVEDIPEETVEEVQEEIVNEVPTQEESPHTVEQKPEPKVEKTVEEKKEETQPKPEPKPKPKINSEALYPGATSTKKSNNETSHGDKGQTGDQGVKDGTVDSRALYGKQGGGDGGPLISLSNWTWNKINIVRDPSDENGRIKFKITVDDSGYITAISVVETTVSPSVVRYYQNQVEKFTFKPSAPGANPPAQSSGEITLFIRQQ